MLAPAGFAAGQSGHLVSEFLFLTIKGVKPWQIGLFAVALIAMTFSIMRSCQGDELGLAKQLDMVDAVTGDRFVVKIPGSGSMNVPGKNPATGELTLLPYYKDESGAFKVNDRYAAPIAKKSKGGTFSFDAKTFEVKFSDKDIQTIVGE
jgi:hypothetical protein